MLPETVPRGYRSNRGRERAGVLSRSGSFVPFEQCSGRCPTQHPEEEDHMRPQLHRSRWVILGATVMLTFGGGSVLAASAAAPSTPSSFVATQPVRVLDTRNAASPIQTL